MPRQSSKESLTPPDMQYIITLIVPAVDSRSSDDLKQLVPSKPSTLRARYTPITHRTIPFERHPRMRRTHILQLIRILTCSLIIRKGDDAINVSSHIVLFPSLHFSKDPAQRCSIVGCQGTALLRLAPLWSYGKVITLPVQLLTPMAIDLSMDPCNKQTRCFRCTPSTISVKPIDQRNTPPKIFHPRRSPTKILSFYEEYYASMAKVALITGGSM